MSNTSDRMKLHKKKKILNKLDSAESVAKQIVEAKLNSFEEVNKSKIEKSNEENNNVLNKRNTITNRKRTNGQIIDQVKKAKNRKCLETNASALMSRLEEFSNVWNDCPDVNNYTYMNHLPGNHETKGFTQVNNDVNNSNKHFQDYFQSNVKKAKTITDEYSLSKITSKTNSKTKHISTSTTETKGEDNKSSVNNEKTSSEVADLKRKKAVLEHRQSHIDQQKLIKQALSALDREKVNKKVIFSDDSDFERNEDKEIIVDKKENERIGHSQLFEDDDSEIDSDLKLNPQFKGKRGQKLLELQSKYASDSRFTLDTRFHDSGSEESENEIPDNENQTDEKDKQLAILASIVNREIKPLSTIKKKFSKHDEHRWLVRFDPTREDHSKYILKPNELNRDAESDEKKMKTKLVKDKKIKKDEKKEETKPIVSDEKFYSVKEDLKEVLKTEKKSEFSLLKLFGPKEIQDSHIEPEESQKPNKIKYKTKNPFKYDSTDSEHEEEIEIISKKNEQTKSAVTQPPASSTWRTTFFFTEHDSRLQEALEFLKAPEDQEDDKEFAEKRKILKVFIKNKYKNNYRKNGLFQKKLGGLKRKPVTKKKLKKK